MEPVFEPIPEYLWNKIRPPDDTLGAKVADPLCVLMDDFLPNHHIPNPFCDVPPHVHILLVDHTVVHHLRAV